MNLLSSKNLSKSQIEDIFKLADKLKKTTKDQVTHSKVLALLFEKTSTRTRISFESAMLKLGGSSIYVDSRTSQLALGETVGDTARIISSYTDIIAARMYRHSDLEQLAYSSSVPVINALTDLEHPCQALSDVYTIREVFGKVKGLRIAFVGDIAANTANSLMVTAARLGADVSLVGPDSCEPNKDYIKFASMDATIEVSDSLEDGLEGCDVIYADTFVSMGEEAEAAARKKLFAPYQVNAKMLKYAKPGVKVMHCLPAHRGVEITSEVLDGRSSVVWQQAANKLHVEKAILLYLLSKAR